MRLLLKRGKYETKQIFKGISDNFANLWGGGILVFAILSNLNAVELSTLCTSFTQDCKITTEYSIITNHSNFVASGGEAIVISPAIGSFINYGDIKVGGGQQTFTIQQNGYIEYFINFGTFSSLNLMGFWVSNAKGISYITNYGVMGSINYNATTPLTLNNLGLIGAGEHIKTSGKISIQNYMVRISETASIFNNFTNGTNNPNDFSHLVINDNSGQGSVRFKDGDSKLILDFGSGFEFGEKYLISKLATDQSGNATLGVDFGRLTTRNDIYTLYKQGDYFIARLQPQHSAISNINKANIRTMNNFYTISNSMIYPRKLYHSQNLGKKNQNNLVILRERSDRRISKSNIIDSSPKAQNDSIMLDSAIPLKSYESFAYRNESINRRIQRQNKRNYSRTKRNNSPVILSESEESQKKNNRDSSPKAQNDNGRKSQNQSISQTQRNPQTQRFSQNLAQNINNYYFILTPFFNHNSFAQSGNYNLSGFDYGFLTAFSTQVAESNSLGAHFIFSYGSLGDSKDKDLSIKNLNLNVGLNYKLDLIYDMYLKARGDFFYFLNQVKTLTMFEAIKPNNLGFGASVIFGKDFDFGKGGVLGVEGGIDYKGLQSNTITLQNSADKSVSETYQKSLYNLIYVDLGMSYNKYFGNFGLNAGLGIKGNITANKLATSKIHISSFNKSVNMVLDNDNFLGYANLGASYVLNHKDFDMEFSLAYYGNFGDRVISNGGGFEFLVVF